MDVALSGRFLDVADGEIVERLHRILSGLGPAPRETVLSDPAVEVRIGWGEPLEPWQLYMMLVDVIGCPDWGRWEKVAWTAPLMCGDTRVVFEHRKFGLFARLHGEAGSGDAKLLVDRVLRQLEKGWEVVRRRVVQPMLDESVEVGAVTIPNKYLYYVDMFEHLRRRADESAAKIAAAGPVTTAEGAGVTVSFPAAIHARESEYEAHAALFAFFGLIEHLLVIAVAFADFEPSRGNLNGFLGATWSEKFRRLVDVNDPANQRAYETLRTLADENRNPAAHGSVERRSTNLDADLPGYGSIPQGVGDIGKRSKYTFKLQVPPSLFPFALLDVGAGDQADGWRAIDAILDWIESGPLRLPADYGRSGLPISFEANSRDELRAAAAQSRETLAALITAWHERADMASNMDW